MRCLHDTRSEGEEPKAELINAGVEGEARDDATDAILPGNSAQTGPGSGSFDRYNKYVDRMILIMALLVDTSVKHSDPIGLLNV